MLSLAAIPGSFAVARLGPLVTLVVAILVVALASMARGLAPPTSVLFLSTVVMGFGVAVMQPAFPALVLRWCPGFVALGSAVYMNGMLMGEFLGGGLTMPWLLPLLDGDWRSVIVAWSLPALSIALLVLSSGRLGIRQHDDSDASLQPVWIPPFGNPQVWLLGIVMGAASAGFFGTNAYLATLLELKGRIDQLPEYLFIFNGTQVISSLAMVALATRLIGKREPIIIAAWSILIGLTGVVLFDGLLAKISITMLGVSTCVQLILIVGLVPQIVDSRNAAPLAAGMFIVGYFLGFVVPLIGGATADAVGDPRLTMLPLIVLAIAAAAISHYAKRMLEA
jgi:CP family cyanate transporter-like MFS transporter